MSFETDSQSRGPLTGTTTTSGVPRHWFLYGIGTILVMLVMLWMAGAFDLASIPAPAPPAAPQ
jgi:hypothetical protein